MRNYNEFVEMIEDSGWSLNIVKFLKAQFKSKEIDLSMAANASKVAYLLGLREIKSAKKSVEVDIILMLLQLHILSESKEERSQKKVKEVLN